MVGVALILLFQATATIALLGIERTPKPADAVFVFAGSPQRIAAGFDLYRKGLGEKLVISPAPVGTLERYVRSYGPIPWDAMVPEPKARTTFENAYWLASLARRHGWKRIVLVTSAYHAPRSRLLTWIMTRPSGVSVSVFTVTDGSPTVWAYVRSNWKILYNEMVKCWGSLGEALWYACRGTLPAENPKAVAWLQKLKAALLLEGVRVTH